MKRQLRKLERTVETAVERLAELRDERDALRARVEELQQRIDALEAAAGGAGDGTAPDERAEIVASLRAAVRSLESGAAAGA